MKKIIFLFILAVAFAGFMPAWETVGPPGALALEAALYGDSADGRTVTPDTVLVLAMPATVELSSFQAVMANYEKTTIQPQSGAIPVIDTGQFVGKPAAEETLAKKTVAETDYYLLC